MVFFYIYKYILEKEVGDWRLIQPEAAICEWMCLYHLSFFLLIIQQQFISCHSAILTGKSKVSPTCVKNLYYINHIKLATAAQNISVFLCLQRFVSGRNIFTDREDQNIFRNRHLPLTMRSLLFFSTLFFFFHSSKSDFASQLAAFINETVSEAILLNRIEWDTIRI